jgi:hypothetical protein
VTAELVERRPEAAAPWQPGPRMVRRAISLVPKMRRKRQKKPSESYPPNVPSQIPTAKTMPPPMITWTIVFRSGVFIKR